MPGVAAAIERLAMDPALRRCLVSAAQQGVRERHLPEQFAAQVRELAGAVTPRGRQARYT